MSVVTGFDNKQDTMVNVVTLPPVADPAPLGLAAFALTTFLLSAANAGWMGKASGDAWIGFAFAYGGVAQLLAGMWEFRNRNVFGATAFSTYGAFWIGLGLYVELVVPGSKATASQIANDLGWILLAFLICNTYLLFCSAFVNKAVFAVFLILEVTLAFLAIGNLSISSGVVKVGGYLGLITALGAWYASSAGLINGITGREMFPVGKPLMSAAAPPPPS